ncbi:MAG: recombinase family protein [Phycisphaerae bacterium]|nr:recombinase family protein [Phycisphaerae bacterium]
MLWTKAKKTPTRRAVAYYRHSAQDRQENSVEIQQDQVRKFAADNGIEIIREFADRGKSGLSAEGRDSFNEMLHEYVVGGKANFELVLVLDVSRWGRFQETDLSAYYTGLCLQHGKQVVFTTIGFPKENDLLHGLHLSIERYRAASYSRELSGKVWKGCAKIAGGGYWAGGSAPYGMCRILLDEKRNPLQVLARGEHKAIHNQRVTLGPGDPAEIEAVRFIFNQLASGGVMPEAIAERLNEMGRPAPGGGQWSRGAVRAILGNEIYAGAMVWNKTSQKMKSRSHHNPASDWIRAEDAFEAVVPRAVFDRARDLLRERDEARLYKYSGPGMVEKLRDLYERYGIVSHKLVAAGKDMPSPATYVHRFRGFDLAYQAIFRHAIEARREAILSDIRRVAADVEQFDDFFVVDNYFSLTIQPAVPIPRGYEACWVFHPDTRREVDLTIGVPLSCPRDLEVLGYLVFPRVLCDRGVRIHTATSSATTLYSYSLAELLEELRR